MNHEAINSLKLLLFGVLYRLFVLFSSWYFCGSVWGRHWGAISLTTPMSERHDALL
jgi:hypothetical protein